MYNVVMEFDIEKSMEKYYRNIVADDIDGCLYTSKSEDEEEQRQVYWFNQGMMLASMIARYGFTEKMTDE
jgi:hypothetical protein